MKHVFVLCLPRSRTAWLTMFLNGAGVTAIHDGWQYAKSAKQLRRVMGAYEDEVAVNVDSANILFYDEIREEFPDAEFIKIIRNVKDVKKSLKKSYGKADYSSILRYAEALKTVEAGITVDYDNWTEYTSSEIFRFVTGEVLLDLAWLTQAHDFKVTITKDKIRDDLRAAEYGLVGHIVNKLRG